MYTLVTSTKLLKIGDRKFLSTVFDHPKSNHKIHFSITLLLLYVLPIQTDISSMHQELEIRFLLTEEEHMEKSKKKKKQSKWSL